jgi:hypothetical protein
MMSPIGVGDARPSRHTLTTDTGVFSLSGLSTGALAMHYAEQPNGNVRVGTGTWTISGDGTAGIAFYAPSPLDVATPGTYKVYPVVTLASGPVPFMPQMLEILNLT